MLVANASAGKCGFTGLYLYNVPAYCPQNTARAAPVDGNDDSASTTNNCSNKKDGGLVDYTVIWYVFHIVREIEQRCARLN